MTEILIIAFQFPPINVAGSIRPFMFSKYLPHFNIKPHIVTLDVYSQNDYKIDTNNDLLNELPSQTNMYPASIKKKKNGSIEKFKQIYLRIGDDKYRRWKKNAIKKIDEIIAQNDIKLVYCTAPPFSIGNLAQSTIEKHKLPLILDMRDGWSKWCTAPFASILHYHATRLKEASYFNSAAKIITVTDVLKDVFIETHPKIDSSKFQVIPNGFDLNFNEIPKTLNSNILENSEEIKIGYIGHFYYTPSSEKSLMSSWWQRKPYRWFQYFPVNEKWIYRSPFYFLKALAKFIDNNPKYKQKIKFVFIGKEQDWLTEMVEKIGLTNNFEYRGFVEHSKLEGACKDINYFLTTSVKVEGGLDYAIASKSFDYIKFKKPILAFVTEGSQKEFIKNSNTGIIFNPDEIEINSNKLTNLFENGCTLETNINYLDTFTRKNSTEALSLIIKKILA